MAAKPLDQLSAASGVIIDKDADQELVARCRRGDWSAFTDLVVRYQRPLYNAAFWIVRNPEDARDVTQTAFLKAAERLEEFDGRHRFFSWIYRIAVNEALNWVRQNGRDEPLDDDFDMADSQAAEPEWQVGAAEVSQRIRAAVMRMSVNDRVVITLRHFSELSYEEIARTLDIDVKTVKSRLFDARKRLSELLADLRYH